MTMSNLSYSAFAGPIVALGLPVGAGLTTVYGRVAARAGWLRAAGMAGLFGLGMSVAEEDAV